jgi:prefoldin subunit 5
MNIAASPNGNPRLQVRVPRSLYAQLPTDEKERSRLVLKLLEDYYNPVSADAAIANLRVRIEQLEHRLYGV